MCFIGGQDVDTNFGDLGQLDRGMGGGEGAGHVWAGIETTKLQ